MQHERHKRMGYPLIKREMLALILYCNGGCNYDLSRCQRNNQCNRKWPFFDSYLNTAIQTLSHFEQHQENIYTGLCNVYYKFRDKIDVLYFKTNVSFTSNLTVAKEFRGNEGLIIGLNMSRSMRALMQHFRACDVSWISRFPSEKEILCMKGASINCYKYKMIQKGKQQWMVCDDGNLQETSFHVVFGDI